MRITKLWMIYLIVICLAVCFLFLNSGLDFDYVIPNRLLRLATIVIAGICVAFSSIV
ncbi:iron ABC transporter permease, partial [Acinetobacter baumannii]